MHRSSESLRQREARARSCAALVMRFHAQLRDPFPMPTSAPIPPPAFAPPPRPAKLSGDDLGERSALRSVLAVLKWFAIGAAILAPWVLLLSG
jgi:hypothetical protein